MEQTINPRIFKLNKNDLISEAKTKNDYKGVVVHHAQYITPADKHLSFMIDEWHAERGVKSGWEKPWQGIFYGFVVERDGTPYITHHMINGTEQVGAAGMSPEREYHYNKDLIHICLSMNGNKQKLTGPQLGTMRDLVYSLSINNPTEKGMCLTHGMLSKEKTCPGFYVNKYMYDISDSYQTGIEMRLKIG